MNRAELKNILQEHYDRVRWNKTLHFLSGNRNLLQLSLEPKLIEINTTEADRIVKTFYQVGTLKTSDGVTLPVFEIILEDNIRIEYNKAGVNDFIKKYIIKDAVKGALATFAYETDERKEWRFSFISKNSASDFFAEAESVETNPKKYTYIFGTEDEHRTAIERLYNLEQSRFRLEDFFEAFNVEPVSKKFFDEYKLHYKEISEFLIDSPYFSVFEKQDDENHNPKKEVRNFVSRLMGRIVFLYFLQKKYWLGASNTDYSDGNPNFLSDLFFNDAKNQNDFYQKYLCPIFFNALNTPDRNNDEFLLENGDKISIPFLNGGLFEEEHEPTNHRTIKLRKDLLEGLFKFFNGYNFTIYENSPEEHTVAVDPEMLGHIFENLIDYNKDTGTFYTPKEIVQYMTQESLTEYLATHLQKDRTEIEQMIKNQSVSHFSNTELQEVEQLLDAVKICDPAIGSGAFPMGMLQEIFNVKALIAYRLKKEWDPATVKQNIIQNSIYGVDLDEGAVEIARLRFWLSLVVDEGKPKALPNLDYKIMQGNSVVESYKGIDLSKIASGNDLQIVEDLQTDLFGNLVNDQMKMTVGKSGLAEEIESLTKKFFNAKTTDKQNIKRKIQEKITEHIEFNFELRENQYIRRIAELEGVKNLKSNQLKFLEKLKAEFAELGKTQQELKKIQQKDEKPYFLWHLFFGDVLKKGGFDIVIGNPPYIQIQKLGYNSIELERQNFQTFKKTGDIYALFYEKAINILKNEGTLSYITSNTWMRTKFGEDLRSYFLQNIKILNLLNFEDTQIFPSATVEVNILIAKKAEWQFPINATVVKAMRKEETIASYVDKNYSKIEYLDSEGWIILDNKNFQLKRQIEESGVKLKNWDIDFYRGFLTGFNDAFFIDEKTKNEIISKEPKAEKIIKPLLRGRNISKYSYLFDKIYTLFIPWHFPLDKNISGASAEAEKVFQSQYPIVYNHLLTYKKNLENRNKSETGIRYEWYALQRAAATYVEEFEKEKIVWLAISDKPAFALDTEKMYVTAPAYIMTSDRNKYLLAFLNSKIMEWYLDKVSSSTGQGTNQWSKIFVEQLPIPIINDYRKIILEILVELTISTKKIKEKIIDIIDNEHISKFFEELIDAVVFEIYFPVEMQDNKITVISQIEEILQKYDAENFTTLTNDKKKEMVATLYFAFKESEVQKKMRQFVTASPDVLKVILQS
ncbi:Eco57I restriction-modification methylase domain-containing protein [Chryseobacterium arthrosphaerae]|uniref:Eco57I restriction-modification methylase domain-containing protein n=1 Tax=Chryseobacterium arthrosphaerae TaxID=651561 RepID=UPI001BAFD5BB|nr:TaqI-like C-terminal specificity domain-containing protein [Chryseobacterium arthrosphaerae]QUY53848.1 Eco57I restriction-modification methylase domain-containing protein [Chryseobacterium arthrosphaerae]